MAKLSLSWLELPSADLGSKNPHACLDPLLAKSVATDCGDVISDFGLPYRNQDGYDRELQTRSHRVAILESNRLRATFTLDLGGRLWSLHNKSTGTNLLYSNPVFQPANLAIRNAWISGGIEWNVGLFGHSPFTCSPVFAARTIDPDGGDGLRIWEFERKRGVTWQIDFWAPDDSEFLYWMPKIVNEQDTSVPMYWWTCIGIAEEFEARVVAPARTAMEPDHENGDIPMTHDLGQEADLTYPQRRQLPHDTYFDVLPDTRPWIASLSQDGLTKLHVSSSELSGRKQWVWGMEPCGRRWQDWLSQPGQPYIEIQAGLLSRQAQYKMMPGKTEWSWLECFGATQARVLPEWADSVAEVANRITELLPDSDFEARAAKMVAISKTAPLEVIHTGSGWGSLEMARRFRSGMPASSSIATPYPASSLTAEQSLWIQILEGNTANGSGESPQGYVGPEWMDRLEAIESPNDLHLLHLGFVYFQAGEFTKARSTWDRSGNNPWAKRNLAYLDAADKNLKGACIAILDAHRLLPSDPNIIDDACRLLLRAAQFSDLKKFLTGLSSEQLMRPRVRLAGAQIALIDGDIDATTSYFASACDLVDIREAETTLSELWKELCKVDPSKGDGSLPPAQWDFRMKR